MIVCLCMPPKLHSTMEKNNGVVFELVVLLLLVAVFARSDGLELGDAVRLPSRPRPCPRPRTAAARSNVLYSGEVLRSGESLVYRDYSLNVTDCRFTIYKNRNDIIYQTPFQDSYKNCYLNFDLGQLWLIGFTPDSIFFPRRPWLVWYSDHKNLEPKDYALVLDFDGSLRVYGPPVWSTDISSDYAATAERSPWCVPLPVDSTLWAGDVAPIGTTIACNQYKLELPGDCNFTLIDTNTNRALWSINKTDKYQLYDCFVTFDDKATLTVKYIGGAPLWSNGLQLNRSDYVLMLRPDGNLVIHGPYIYSPTISSRNRDEAVKESHGERKKIAMVTE